MESFTAEHLDRLPYGMRDIIGNAMHLDRPPDNHEFVTSMGRLSRANLFTAELNSQMLVINGADDYFVAQSDTLIFQGRPRTEVHLLPGTGHCAMSKITDVVPMVIGWLAPSSPPPATQYHHQGVMR